MDWDKLRSDLGEATPGPWEWEVLFDPAEFPGADWVSSGEKQFGPLRTSGDIVLWATAPHVGADIEVREVDANLMAQAPALAQRALVARNLAEAVRRWQSTDASAIGDDSLDNAPRIAALEAEAELRAALAAWDALAA